MSFGTLNNLIVDLRAEVKRLQDELKAAQDVDNKISQNRVDNATLLWRQENELLRLEITQLKGSLADIADAQKVILSEQCAQDEQHCTCVPVLRAEMERLKAENERLKAEIERWKALEAERAEWLRRTIGSAGLEHFVREWMDLKDECDRYKAALVQLANAGDDCDMDGHVNWTGINGSNPIEHAQNALRGDE